MSQWRDQHKFELQAGALLIGLIAPFALYSGIMAGLHFLAIGSFAAIVSSMMLVLWAG